MSSRASAFLIAVVVLVVLIAAALLLLTGAGREPVESPSPTGVTAPPLG